MGICAWTAFGNRHQRMQNLFQRIEIACRKDLFLCDLHGQAARCGRTSA
eukprot:CAMPEP_0184410326 /NCGR_PEP_ID=MMETSP0738-20130409/4794_1 /TAXON_ID=385413 /ORGANISM="Thalassiosira miniscula, Strain CCMP1093" /LENGTH=48 /DNA_ID= /DNA_START= /DNA_END= /DNA_ORIENTATION=